MGKVMKRLVILILALIGFNSLNSANPVTHERIETIKEYHKNDWFNDLDDAQVIAKLRGLAKQWEIHGYLSNDDLRDVNYVIDCVLLGNNCDQARVQELILKEDGRDDIKLALSFLLNPFYNRAELLTFTMPRRWSADDDIYDLEQEATDWLDAPDLTGLPELIETSGVVESKGPDMAPEPVPTTALSIVPDINNLAFIEKYLHASAAKYTYSDLIRYQASYKKQLYQKDRMLAVKPAVSISAARTHLVPGGIVVSPAASKPKAVVSPLDAIRGSMTTVAASHRPVVSKPALVPSAVLAAPVAWIPGSNINNLADLEYILQKSALGFDYAALIDMPLNDKTSLYHDINFGAVS